MRRLWYCVAHPLTGRYVSEDMMSKEEITLVAAILAATTSIVSLVLSSRLTLNRDKRMASWNKEVERLHQLEEKIGLAMEIVSVYTGIDEKKNDYIPLHDELKYIAGKFSRYPALAKAIRGFVHACNLTVHSQMEHRDERPYKEDVQKQYDLVIVECDRILNPKWYSGLIRSKT